jgi:hypothetical protein
MNDAPVVCVVADRHGLAGRGQQDLLVRADPGLVLDPLAPRRH